MENQNTTSKKNQEIIVKRDWDNWLKSIRDNFPNKGFKINIVQGVDEGFEVRFTPTHTTPTVFCRDEKSVTNLLFNISITLSVLQAQG